MKCSLCLPITLTVLNIFIVICASVLAVKTVSRFFTKPPTTHIFTNSFHIVVCILNIINSCISCYAIWRHLSNLECCCTICLVILFCIYVGLLTYTIIRIQRDLDVLNDQSLYLELIQSGRIRNMELRYGCCGYNGWKDYEDLKKQIPPSCCGFSGYYSCKKKIAAERVGCAESLRMYVYTTLKPRCAILAVLAILQLMSLVILICSRINNMQTNVVSDFSLSSQPYI